MNKYFSTRIFLVLTSILAILILSPFAVFGISFEEPFGTLVHASVMVIVLSSTLVTYGVFKKMQFTKLFLFAAYLIGGLVPACILFLGYGYLQNWIGETCPFSFGVQAGCAEQYYLLIAFTILDPIYFLVLGAFLLIALGSQLIKQAVSEYGVKAPSEHI